MASLENNRPNIQKIFRDLTKWKSELNEFHAGVKKFFRGQRRLSDTQFKLLLEFYEREKEDIEKEKEKPDDE